jgi:DNA-binding transcriptional MerR regulator
MPPMTKMMMEMKNKMKHLHTHPVSTTIEKTMHTENGANATAADSRVYIPNRIYFRIGDVAEILGVKPYVIRFWEGEFPFVAPDKASSGQRVYRRSQIEALILVKHLLHIERYSIEGAKKKLTELRKQAKLKESMVALVRSDDDVLNARSTDVAAAKIGDVISRPAATHAPENLPNIQQKLVELQKLIREPMVNGQEVPGLKSIQ